MIDFDANEIKNLDERRYSTHLPQADSGKAGCRLYIAGSGNVP